MSTNFRLLSGYTSIISGILLIFGHILNLGGGMEFGTVLGETLVLSAHLLLVFAFLGLFEVQSGRNGILGLLGMITGVIGTILVSVIVYVEIAGASGTKIDSVFASVVPSIIHSFGPLLFVVGMILFGISVVRDKVLPRGGGYLLILGTIIFVAGSFAGEAQAIIEVIGAVSTGGGLIWLGLPMVKNQNQIANRS
jgi:hypothetical protein